MKYTWEESDIVGGQWVTHRANHRSDCCISWCSSGDKKWGLTAVMSDGLFLPLGNIAVVAKWLTENGWEPRPKPEVKGR